MDSILDDILMDEDDEQKSPSEILKELTTAWVNEKNAPELLQYSHEAVDNMMDQIVHMESNLDMITDEEDIRLIPCRMEVNRIRYILASYHRCRLEKIEIYAEHLVDRDKASPTADRIMSANELIFAEEFLQHLKQHFSEEALKYMPQGAVNSRLLTTVKPNPHSSVFVDIIRPSQRILINDRSEDVELPVGSRHLLPYDHVNTLIKNGSATLL